MVCFHFLKALLSKRADCMFFSTDALFISLIRSICRHETVYFKTMKKQFAARHFSTNLARKKTNEENLLHLWWIVSYIPSPWASKPATHLRYSIKNGYRGRFHTKDDKTLKSRKIPLLSSKRTSNTIVCWLKIVEFFLP